MDKTEIIQKLQTVKPLLSNKYGLTEMALFGSVTRDDWKEKSDIDILIDMQRNTSENLFNIAFALQDLFLPRKVDVVTRKGIKPAYLEVIEKDLLYV